MIQLNKTQDRVHTWRAVCVAAECSQWYNSIKHRTVYTPRQQCVWQLNVLNDSFVLVPTRLDRVCCGEDWCTSVQWTDDAGLRYGQSLLLLSTSINQSMNQMNESINQSDNQSINLSIHQSISQQTWFTSSQANLATLVNKSSREKTWQLLAESAIYKHLNLAIQYDKISNSAKRATRVPTITNR